MIRCKYLIIGSSHAGLSALDAIRVRDPEGSLVMVTREELLPYSPTILPYVISGQSRPEAVFLRFEEDLERFKVDFKQNSTVIGVESEAHSVLLESGETIRYEKLLLATGSAPASPPFSGLETVPYHALRTLNDARRIRTAMEHARSAIVLGAGLIAMHAAEKLAKSGIPVTVVVRSRPLRGYFDEQATELIQTIFASHGVTIMGNTRVNGVEQRHDCCAVIVENGDELLADALVVATGVKPCMDCLVGMDIRRDQGIMVDERMRTSAPDIWAAGDVAQSLSFFDGDYALDATLPSAVEQGRIAGMDMVGDPHLKPYTGGIAVNTYNFFGNRAFSVGLSAVSDGTKGMEVHRIISSENLKYQKFIFHDNRLVGASCINSTLDPGIMYQLIRRKIDMQEVKDRFITAPLEIGRILMSKLWR